MVLATVYDAGIQPQAGIVDENPAVDLSDIDPGGRAVDKNWRGLLQIQGNPEFLGEVVERAARQYAQRLAGFGEHRGNRIDGAVSAACRYQIGVLGQGSPREVRNFIAAVRNPYPGIPVA